MTHENNQVSKFAGVVLVALIGLAVWAGAMLNLEAPLEAQTTFDAGRVTVATTATAVFRSPARGATVLLCNRHSASVFLGPSTVTTANGFELAAGDCTSQTPYPRTTVYAIVAAATARVDYAAGTYRQ